VIKKELMMSRLVTNRERLISVVIPTFNRAKQVAHAINRVLSQTYDRIEIVVVDDGSTDCTRDAIRAIIKRDEESRRISRIRYFYQPNKGQSAARNKGIAEANGDWIAFLDSDDDWLPEKLELQVRAIEQFHASCGACFTDARLVDNQGFDTTAFQQAGWYYKQPMGIDRDRTLCLVQTFGGIWIQTLLARTDLVRQIGGFDPNLHFGEDYDFLFRLSLVTAHCYVNSVLAVIDRTNAFMDPTVASRSWDKIDFCLRGREYMYGKWLKSEAKYPEDMRKAIIRNLGGVHSGWTNWYLEEKQFDKARQAVSTAIRYQMTPRLAIKWALTWIVPHIARRIAPRTASMFQSGRKGPRPVGPP
jgi:glycosyltransferase involved in cell wall biosynthesis